MSALREANAEARGPQREKCRQSLLELLRLSELPRHASDGLGAKGEERRARGEGEERLGRKRKRSGTRRRIELESRERESERIEEVERVENFDDFEHSRSTLPILSVLSILGFAVDSADSLGSLEFRLRGRLWGRGGRAARAEAETLGNSPRG